jgi:hypothetical protein
MRVLVALEKSLSGRTCAEYVGTELREYVFHAFTVYSIKQSTRFSVSFS